MYVIRYDRAQQRVWICRHRVHHGLVGGLLVALGAVLMAHDRADYPWLYDLP